MNKDLMEQYACGLILVRLSMSAVTRASIYSVFFENRFRFFSIPNRTNPVPNPIPNGLKNDCFLAQKLTQCINFGLPVSWHNKILIKFMEKRYSIGCQIGVLFIFSRWKLNSLKNMLFWRQISAFSREKSLFHGNRNRRLSNSIPIPNFGIEYPVPGFDSGRPNSFDEIYLIWEREDRVVMEIMKIKIFVKSTSL